MFKILFLTLTLVLCLSGSLWAGGTVDISGSQIPLIEGARSAASSFASGAGAKVASYVVNKPLNEVVDFYANFFAQGSFSLLGGKQADGSFDAAVKKDASQFSLRIYSLDGRTHIQFIW